MGLPRVSASPTRKSAGEPAVTTPSSGTNKSLQQAWAASVSRGVWRVISETNTNKAVFRPTEAKVAKAHLCMPLAATSCGTPRSVIRIPEPYSNGASSSTDAGSCGLPNDDYGDFVLSARDRPLTRTAGLGQLDNLSPPPSPLQP